MGNSKDLPFRRKHISSHLIMLQNLVVLQTSKFHPILEAVHMILVSLLAWIHKNKLQYFLQKEIVEPSANLFPPSFSLLSHDGKSRSVAMTGNECSTNLFGTLVLFQQSKRPKLPAPSVGHFGLIEHLLKFSGSACFLEDSPPGK